MKLYSAVWAPSKEAEGAFVGTMISGMRYFAGRTVVTIQDLLVLVVGLSFFLAAAMRQ